MFASVLLSLFFPGFGQGLAFRRWRMVGLSVATVITTVAILWSVWFVPITLALRLGAAIDAYVLLRKDAPAGNRVLAVAAIVIGAISGFSYSITLEAFAIPSSSMYPTLVIGDRVYVDTLSIRWRPPERGEIIVFEQPCARIPYIKRVIAIAGDTVEVRCNRVFVNGTAIAEQLVEPNASYQDRDEHGGRYFARSATRYRETHGGHTYDVFHDVTRPKREAQRAALGATTGETGGDVHDFPDRARMFAPSCQQSDFYAPKPGAATQPIGTLVVTKPDAQPCEQQAHFVVPANALFVMGDNRNNANDSRYWGAVSVDAVIGRAIGVYYSRAPGADVAWGRIGDVQ